MNTNTLINVREGMKVYDRNNKHVGTVEFVRMGDEDVTQAGPETATPSAEPYINPLAEALADVFSPEELPQPVRDRLLRYGFIRIEPGTLFGRDRYVAADQVAGVSDDRVLLKLSADELAKPTE
jgi:hypothetical protein